MPVQISLVPVNKFQTILTHISIPINTNFVVLKQLCSNQEVNLEESNAQNTLIAFSFSKLLERRLCGSMALTAKTAVSQVKCAAFQKEFQICVKSSNRSYGKIKNIFRRLSKLVSSLSFERIKEIVRADEQYFDGFLHSLKNMSIVCSGKISFTDTSEFSRIMASGVSGISSRDGHTRTVTNITTPDHMILLPVRGLLSALVYEFLVSVGGVSMIVQENGVLVNKTQRAFLNRTSTDLKVSRFIRDAEKNNTIKAYAVYSACFNCSSTAETDSIQSSGLSSKILNVLSALARG